VLFGEERSDCEHHGESAVVIQLTRSQIRLLRYYLDHRNQPPTVVDFLRKFGLVLLLWVAFAAASCWYCFSKGMPEFAYVLIGLFAGAILREIRQLIWTMQVWPAAVAITDWRRVEELLAGSTGNAEPGAAADRPRGFATLGRFFASKRCA